MTDALIKRENLNTDMHTGRKPREEEDRNQGDTRTCYGMPKIARKPPEARQKAWNKLFFTVLRENQSCQHLDFGFLTSRAVRK